MAWYLNYKRKTYIKKICINLDYNIISKYYVNPIYTSARTITCPYIRKKTYTVVKVLGAIIDKCPILKLMNSINQTNLASMRHHVNHCSKLWDKPFHNVVHYYICGVKPNIPMY